MLDEFFYMQKSDRKVIITLLAVIAITLSFIYWAGGDESTALTTGLDSTAAGRLTNHGTDSSPSGKPYYRVDKQPTRLFAFDPNTADSTQLLALGLAPFQVRAIYRYRAKGGIYRSPEHFGRLPGLTVKDYRRLKPYIRISPDFQPAAQLKEVRQLSGRTQRQEDYPFGLDSSVFPKKIAPGQQVALNTADSATLCTVPGISHYFARQILGYGRRLGGYVSVDQLDEIDFFPQQAKQYFTIVSPQTRRLNVNRLTLNQLQRHPYVGFRQAKAIVDYRRLHGPITSLSQLSLSPDFTPELISRLEPYVEY